MIVVSNMPAIASVSLLYVAAGLLLLAGVSIGRGRGQQPSRTTEALMAAMTGVALGFLLRLLFAGPLLAFPVVIGGMLIASWINRRARHLVGAFLVGAGGLWAAMDLLALASDLSDPAVSYPGWTPIPLAAGVAAVILGVVAILVGGSEAT
jgi:hypothetical protein